jgi:hypothetical protein
MLAFLAIVFTAYLVFTILRSVRESFQRRPLEIKIRVPELPADLKAYLKKTSLIHSRGDEAVASEALYVLAEKHSSCGIYDVEKSIEQLAMSIDAARFFTKEDHPNFTPKGVHEARIGLAVGEWYLLRKGSIPPRD